MYWHFCIYQFIYTNYLYFGLYWREVLQCKWINKFIPTRLVTGRSWNCPPLTWLWQLPSTTCWHGVWPAGVECHLDMSCRHSSKWFCTWSSPSFFGSLLIIGGTVTYGVNLLHLLCFLSLSLSLSLKFSSLHLYTRLFHQPLLYEHIHKTHHEITDPFSIASIYCHPLEHFLLNLFPVTLGPLLLGAHLSTFWLWYVLVIASTTISHSGYRLPFLPFPEIHRCHHSQWALLVLEGWVPLLLCA